MKTFHLKAILPFLIVVAAFSGVMNSGCNAPKNHKTDVCDTTRTANDTLPVDYKPNLYLYPDRNMEIGVKVSFPGGGEIIRSVPEYGNGWTVQVDTNGLIDRQYGFLFYESRQPDNWQMEEGWAVPAGNMAGFFRANLHRYGFERKEVTDFLEYWGPKFTEYSTYLIYPQETKMVDKAIQLDFSVKPDNILRLHYLIVGTNGPFSPLKEPPVPDGFARKGFVVTEWGVILK